MTCEPWPIQWTCATADFDEELPPLAVEAAQALLWSLTGRRLGICSATEAYILAGRVCRLPGATRDRGECCRIDLDRTPVIEVTEVVVDGEIRDPDTWTLEGNRIRSLSGCWPTSTDDCADPSIEITYRHGYPLTGMIGSMAALAMGEVTCEFLRGFTKGECRLPSGILSSVTRNGVSMEFESSIALREARRLGLPLADALIDATNPNGRTSRPRITSPDLPRRIR